MFRILCMRAAACCCWHMYELCVLFLKKKFIYPVANLITGKLTSVFVLLTRMIPLISALPLLMASSSGRRCGFSWNKHYYYYYISLLSLIFLWWSERLKVSILLLKFTCTFLFLFFFFILIYTVIFWVSLHVENKKVYEQLGPMMCSGCFILSAMPICDWKTWFFMKYAE